MATNMSGTHQSTYDSVFQHPLARNLQWRDVRSMLTALADVTEEHADNVKFTRNGQTVIVHPPRRKDFSDVNELMHIRHFLERSGSAPPTEVPAGTHLLVVIDHREARIFKTEFHGSVPQRITPYGTGRHLHNVEQNANGQRKPEVKTYYEAVASTLKGAEQILVLGSSTGSSSAMDHLLGELRDHHPELARKVVAWVVVNEQHMSDDQLLAKARELYLTLPHPGEFNVA